MNILANLLSIYLTIHLSWLLHLPSFEFKVCLYLLQKAFCRPWLRHSCLVLSSSCGQKLSLVCSLLRASQVSPTTWWRKNNIIRSTNKLPAKTASIKNIISHFPSFSLWTASGLCICFCSKLMHLFLLKINAEVILTHHFVWLMNSQKLKYKTLQHFH